MPYDRTIKQTLTDIGPLSETDQECISKGFDHGNYAAAYETEDYAVCARSVTGVNGLYRIGMLLGFFSSFELHEVPEGMRDEVEHYRAVGKLLGFWEE